MGFTNNLQYMASLLFFPHALERTQIRLHVHKPTIIRIALNEVTGRRLGLRALTYRSVAMTVACWGIFSHFLLLSIMGYEIDGVILHNRNDYVNKAKSCLINSLSIESCPCKLNQQQAFIQMPSRRWDNPSESG